MSEAAEPAKNMVDQSTSTHNYESNDPDVQVVPTTKSPGCATELYNYSKDHLRKFYADQSQVFLNTLWEIPFTVLRKKIVMGHVRPIALEVALKPDFYTKAQHPVLDAVADRRRIVDRTCMVKIFFSDKRRNRVRILKRLSRLSDVCYRGVTKDVYEFQNNEFNLVNTDVTMEQRFMDRPEGAIWDWSAESFSNILDDPIEQKMNYCMDDVEPIAQQTIAKYEHIVHDKCALDPEGISANPDRENYEDDDCSNCYANNTHFAGFTPYSAVIRNITDKINFNICKVINDALLAQNSSDNASNEFNQTATNNAFIKNLSNIIGRNISNAACHNKNREGTDISYIVLATLLPILGNATSNVIADNITRIFARSKPAANVAPYAVSATPGNANTAPGNANTAPGNANTAPGNANTASGNANAAPANANAAPINANAASISTTPANVDNNVARVANRDNVSNNTRNAARGNNSAHGSRNVSSENSPNNNTRAGSSRGNNAGNAGASHHGRR